MKKNGNAPVADKRLSKLVEEHRKLLAEAEPLTQRLDEIRGRVAAIEQDELSELLKELELQEAILPDGTKLKQGTYLTASVADRNREQAAAILKRIGALGIAQTVVTFAFDADPENKAQQEQLKALLAFAKGKKLPSEQDEKMNTGTLKSTVSEALEQGLLSPRDLPSLGVMAVDKVQVKYPKVRL